MSLEQKVDQLMQEVLRLIGRVEKRALRADEGGVAATQALDRAGNALHDTAYEIQRSAVNSLSAATRQSVEALSQELKAITGEAQRTCAAGSQRVERAARKLANVVWASIGGIVLVTLLGVGALVYTGMQARQEMLKGEWVGSINAATAIGKLNTCPGSDGGLCALVDKKWVRLDK